MNAEDKKKQVKISYASKGKDKAHLIERGEEVSIVRFLHNGAEQVISNEFVKEIER